MSSDNNAQFPKTAYRVVLLSVIAGICCLHGGNSEAILSCNTYQPGSIPPLTENDLQDAFAYARQQVEDRRQLEMELQRSGQILSSFYHSAEGRHQRTAAQPQVAVPIEDASQLFLEATIFLKNRFQLSNQDALCQLPQIPLEGLPSFLSNQQLCRQTASPQITCNPDDRYRSMDGSCNNLAFPDWGKTFTCYDRILPPAYGDGLQELRQSTSGGPLPNVRSISSVVHRDLDRPSNFSQMLWLFGQFISHDITASPHWVTVTGEMIRCCPTSTHPACRPIQVPINDQFYSNFGQQCLSFVRRATCAKCALGHREPANSLTTFIDGSQIYGTSENTTRSLRTLQGDGRLLSLYDTDVGELLPFSNEPLMDQCSLPTQNMTCFRAGDVRANQHPALTMIHTIWLRQHNRVADRLREINPWWSDDRIFQETRRIISAQLQMVVYNEYLPIVLGSDLMTSYQLWVQNQGYTAYNPSQNPTIFVEFDSAAYRFGHSLVLGLNGNRFASELTANGEALRSAFFYPYSIHRGQLDRIIERLLELNAQDFDPSLTDDLRNHLYALRGSGHGLDLASINLQRGRDHGLPGYTTFLKLFHNKDVKSFDGLKDFISDERIRKLEQVYSSVEDIDLYAGATSEFHVTGGLVGPTFGHIIAEQFQRLKYGDRFYFEHEGQSGSFLPDQLQSIRKSTMSKILCINSKTIQRIRMSAFLEENGTA